MKLSTLPAPFRRLVSVLAMLALLAFSAGLMAKPPGLDKKYSEPYIRSTLVVGKTTMQQVRDSFGEPTSRDRTRGMGLSDSQRTEEQWTYDRRSEKVKPGLLDTIQRKSGAVASLLGAGNSASSAASDVGYRALRTENEVNRRTSGAQELLGSDRAADPDAIIVLQIHFKNGVVERVEY